MQSELIHSGTVFMKKLELELEYSLHYISLTICE